MSTVILTPPASHGAKQDVPQVKDWTIPLISGEAILRAPRPMSEDDFEQLEMWLKLAKKALVAPSAILRAPRPMSEDAALARAETQEVVP